MPATRFALPLAALLLVSVSVGAEPPANDWTRLARGDIPGQRWDVPLGYAPGLNRFLVLGGRTSWGEYRKGPRPYDQLAPGLRPPGEEGPPVRRRRPGPPAG